MESKEFADVPSADASETGSTNGDSAPEDTEESDVSPNMQSSGSSEDPSSLDPSLQRASVPKPPTTHLSLLIFTAVATCRRKTGLSLQSLQKTVTDMGYDMEEKKHYFMRSINNMVSKGQLWQVKGKGATGFFKVNPNIVKKYQPKMRGRKAKEAAKKKGSQATSRSDTLPIWLGFPSHSGRLPTEY
uniref:H15 domain-containing protein n=1 Tax=Podarcis muralis TaxID=64176 RepID=A0A670J4E9_PODMU